MREPVQRTLRQHRVVEEGDPLFDRPIARQDRRRAPVPLEHHLIEVARLPGIQPSQAKVVHDQDVGREQAPHHLFGAVVRAGLVQELQQAVCAQAEHLMPHTAGRVSQRRREEGLSDPDGSQEDHVLAALDEAQGEELAHPISVESDRRIPVEALERLFFLEAGTRQAQREIRLVPARDLVVQGQLQEVELSELRLPRVGDPLRQRRDETPELQAFHGSHERLADLHGRFSFRYG